MRTVNLRYRRGNENCKSKDRQYSGQKKKTDNTVAKRKMTKTQTMVAKILHGNKLKYQEKRTLLSADVNLGSLEELAVPVPLVAPVVSLLLILP